MMLTNVFTKTVGDRAPGIIVATVGIGALLGAGMAVYRDVDTSFYYELPAAILELMGIPREGDVAGIAFGAIYNLAGAFTLAGLAISMGASAVAGEEKAGTLGLLLANPVSRHDVVVSNALALQATTGFGALLLWGLGTAVPAWLDVDMTGIHVGATILALFVNALVYGFVALAVGSWTGSRGAASGAAVAVMLIGYVGTSLFPLVDGLADMARIFPWFYFSGSHPVVNGVHWGHTAVMAGMIVVAFAVARIGVARRDLKEAGTEVTLLDRLRANPRTRTMMERLAGSTRVSRISVKTATEHQTLLIVTSIVIFGLGLMMGPIYALIPDNVKDFVGDFPDVLIAMTGGADMTTAQGFLQAEIFSITGPAVLIVVTATMGATAVAGEEERRTMGLLLANPISRSHVVIDKTIAMIFYAATLGVVTFLGTTAGVLAGGVDTSIANIAAASLMLVPLGLVFGGLALAVGAATGRSRVAAETTAAAGVVSYFLFTFLPLSERFERWAALSPLHHYLGGDPLVNGMDWAGAAVLVAVFATLVAVSVPLFQRRDLRG